MSDVCLITYKEAKSLHSNEANFMVIEITHIPQLLEAFDNRIQFYLSPNHENN